MIGFGWSLDDEELTPEEESIAQENWKKAKAEKAESGYDEPDDVPWY